MLLWNKLMDLLQTPFLLVVRLYWGWLFMVAGFGKLTHLDKATQFFESLHIPFPHVNAMVASSVEFFGGLLLILGLGSRLVSAPLAFTMLVAYWTADHEKLMQVFSEPAEFLSATPATYLFAVLVILVFGLGKASIDSYLESRANRPYSNI
ncbi:MAG: DoxX family protein [Verrucomicrobiota bacterium]